MTSGYSRPGALAGTTASPLSREPARAWPLVGRSAELGRIARERAARAPGVVLLAQAGVGKSRLAREALAQAGREGSATVWVQATRSAATVPLGAFAGVVDAEVGSDSLFELLRGSVRAMANLAAGRPLIVGVDDAQLLDPTSAALVLHLVSTATAFVLATVRGGDPCPDAIQSLWKDAGAQRLELLELSREETEHLVEAVVGGPWKRARVSGCGRAARATRCTRVSWFTVRSVSEPCSRSTDCGGCRCVPASVHRSLN